MTQFKRSNGRSYNEMRPVKVTFDTFGYASGSTLFEIGNTKVLCSVTMQNTVPPFLKGKKSGWLTAEYAMLPTATKQRTQRSSTAMKEQGRSVEISRLISRVLRAVVDLDSLGERSIMVDCDVLQADGGTRAASITGACIALQQAQQRWLNSKMIEKPFLKDQVAAISAGVMKGEPLLDLNFDEDSMIDGDFNFVLTKSGNIVEIQGTAEHTLISWAQFDGLKKLAIDAIADMFTMIDQLFLVEPREKKNLKAPLFSLQNRLQKLSVTDESH